RAKRGDRGYYVRGLCQSRNANPVLRRRRRNHLKNLRILAWSLAVMALLLLSTTRAIGSPPPKTNPPKADCAFSNPGYSGWCRQTVSMKAGGTPKQACE